ncbi:MAG: hypothetical protein GY953_46995, partial [bacterium]|nr:hypothetical protein [bacterium]
MTAMGPSYAAGLAESIRVAGCLACAEIPHHSTTEARKQWWRGWDSHRDPASLPPCGHPESFRHRPSTNEVLEALGFTHRAVGTDTHQVLDGERVVFRGTLPEI